MQNELTANLNRKTFTFPCETPVSHVKPSYSLELVSWGIGEDVFERKMLFIQEPISCADLSLPQLIAALDMCHQPLDFDEDWLERERLVCKGLTEPETMVYEAVTPCVVNTVQWPRAALMLAMPYKHACVLDHQWSLETVLHLVHQATRAGQQHPRSLEVFQGIELHVEPLSWSDDSQDIIGARIPVSMQDPLRPESTQRAEFHVDEELGVFGYDTGTELILWVYDTTYNAL